VLGRCERGVNCFTGGGAWARESRCVQPERQLPAGTIGPAGAFAFAVDFVRYPAHVSAEYLIGYLPFIVFTVGGPMLRLAALAQRAGHRLNNRLRA
jgi:hypothetical protein